MEFKVDNNNNWRLFYVGKYLIIVEFKKINLRKLKEEIQYFVNPLSIKLFSSINIVYTFNPFFINLL